MQLVYKYIYISTVPQSSTTHNWWRFSRLWRAESMGNLRGPTGPTMARPYSSGLLASIILNKALLRPDFVKRVALRAVSWKNSTNSLPWDWSFNLLKCILFTFTFPVQKNGAGTRHVCTFQWLLFHRFDHRWIGDVAGYRYSYIFIIQVGEMFQLSDLHSHRDPCMVW